MSRASQYKTGDPIWFSSGQSGYDPAGKVWKGAGGQEITRTEALHAAKMEREGLGNVVQAFTRDKMSAAAEKFERFVGGFDPFSYEEVSRAGKQQVRPIPGNVLAAYRLSDYYYRTEGDLASAIETPIQVAMRDLDIYSASKEVYNELSRIYDVDGIDLVQKMTSMWLSLAVFSICHPLEVYDKDILRNVVILAPMYVRMGSHLTGDGLLPMNDDPKWTKEALKSLLPRSMYQAFLDTQENKPSGIFDIPDGYLYSIRGLDHEWRLYPKPWMQGAFRSISTRLVYEEMRRAIYEGFRHQLWAFLLGDAEHKPAPEMMRKLISDVEGMSGERTGSLAWWGALRIEVHAPKTDSIMGGDEWWMLTQDIFRRIGVNMRGVTGNYVSTERGGQGFEIDVDLLMEKFENWRKMLLRWERGFRLRYAKRTGDASFVEAMRKTDVVFSLSMMELRKIIKEMLIPLFTTGTLSSKTLLRRAGFNYDTEVKNKQEAKARGEDEVMTPPATYSQTTVNPDTPEKSASTTQTGRPPDQGEAKSPEKPKVEGAIEGTLDTNTFASGVTTALQLFERFSPANSSNTLISALEEIAKGDKAILEALGRQRSQPMSIQAAESDDMNIILKIPAPIIRNEITLMPAEQPAPVVNNEISVLPAPAPTIQNTIEVNPTPVTVEGPTVNNEIVVPPAQVSVQTPAPIITNLISTPEPEEEEITVTEYTDSGRAKKIRKKRIR